MSTRDSNRAALVDRAAMVRLERVTEHALTLMEDYQAELLQKKEEKWTQEWAAAELARRRGIQLYRLESLKAYAKIVWRPNPEHTCTQECHQYFNRSVGTLYRFGRNKCIPAKNNVYVCLETGSVHVCDPFRCTREYGINGTHKKLASACIISGKVKGPMMSFVRFGDNGMCSTKRMANAENAETMREEEVEGKEAEPAAAELSDVEESQSESSDGTDEGEKMETVGRYVEADDRSKRVRITKSSLIVTALHHAKLDIDRMDSRKPVVVETRAPSFITVSKKERRQMTELKSMTLNEKKRKQSEEPVFAFTKTRAITVHQTPEQKRERYLKRGSLHGATDFLNMLVSANVKNALVLYRMREMSKEVTRTLADVMRQFELPYDIAMGRYYRLMRSAIGMEFHYYPVTLDMKVYSQYILAHWEAAAWTLYADDSVKPKHGQLLDFQLFCVGIIYCMANGGMVIEERLDINRMSMLPPAVALKLSQRRFRNTEIPSFPELSTALINREYLHELSKCVAGFPVFPSGVEENAQQFLRNYINARRTALRESFYASIAAEPNMLEKHLKLYLAASRSLKPTEEW